MSQNSEDSELRRLLHHMKLDLARKERKFKKSSRAAKIKKHIKQKIQETNESFNPLSQEPKTFSSSKQSEVVRSSCVETQNIVEGVCNTRSLRGIHTQLESVQSRVIVQSKIGDDHTTKNNIGTLTPDINLSLSGSFGTVDFDSIEEICGKSKIDNENHSRTLDTFNGDAKNYIPVEEFNPEIYLRDEEIEFNCTKTKRRSSRLSEKVCSQESSLLTGRRTAPQVSPLFYSSVKESVRKRLLALNLPQGKNRRIFPQLPKIIIEQNLMNENFREFCLPESEFSSELNALKSNHIPVSHNITDKSSPSVHDCRRDNNTVPTVPCLNNNKENTPDAVKIISSDKKNRIKFRKETMFLKDNFTDGLSVENGTIRDKDNCSKQECIEEFGSLSSFDSYFDHVTPMKVDSKQAPSVDGNITDFSPLTEDFVIKCEAKFMMPYVTSTPITNHYISSQSNHIKICNAKRALAPNQDGAFPKKLLDRSCFQCGGEVTHMASTHCFNGLGQQLVLFTVSKADVNVWLRQVDRWMCMHSWTHNHTPTITLHTLAGDTDVTLLIQSLHSTTVFTWSLTESAPHDPYEIPIPCLSSHRCLCCLRDHNLVIATHAPLTLTKYSLDTGQHCLDPQLTWNHDLAAVTSLCTVLSQPGALLGLASQSHLYIWNHEVGVLLADLPLNLPHPVNQSVVVTSVRDEAGVLLLSVSNESLNQSAGHLVAVNAMTARSKVMHSYPLRHCAGGGSHVLGDHVFSLGESGRLLVYNMATAQFTTHDDDVTTFCVDVDSLYVAHMNGYIHAYKLLL